MLNQGDEESRLEKSKITTKVILVVRSTASHDLHSGCLLVLFEGFRSYIRMAIDMMLLIE